MSGLGWLKGGLTFPLRLENAPTTGPWAQPLFLGGLPSLRAGPQRTYLNSSATSAGFSFLPSTR